MNRLIAFTIATISLLGIMVGNIFAFEIERMYPSYGGYYDYSGWLYHTACVETDEPYSDVSWYINDEYVGLSSSHVDNPKTTAYFHAGGYPGSPLGKQYEIKAVAQSFMDENGNIEQDTDSYNVYVYSSPLQNSKYGSHTMVYMHGSVNVGCNGTTAEAEVKGSIRADAPFEIVYGISIGYKVIRLTPLGFEADVLEILKPPKLKAGFIRTESDLHDRSASDSFSDDYTLFNGGDAGQTYQVQARVEITAQYPVGKPDEQDVLIVEDQADTSIPE